VTAGAGTAVAGAPAAGVGADEDTQDIKLSEN
jgi:hypothetical protein